MEEPLTDVRLKEDGSIVKTIEENFRDWESHVIGYGYGNGETHTLPALKTFFEATNSSPERNYDFRNLERAVGPVVAWLFISILCHANIIEYGTSPRFGWLTPEGERLREFIATKTADELVEIATSDDQDYAHCYPDSCNCGPRGWERGRKCNNPFWKSQ